MFITMMIYMIGMIFAFILGILLIKYEEDINPVKQCCKEDEELQVAILAPITLGSWISVALILIFKYEEIRITWEYLKMKK